MWMSKIKKYLKEIDRTPVLNAMFLILVMCIVLIFFFAVVNGVKQILGLESTEQITSVVSGLATAFTLAFLVYQHQDNTSKNYQMTIVEEAKLVVDKMIEQIEILYKWNGEGLLEINSVMTELSNHAIDFDAFYDEVNDSALKKILLLRWQDMYLHHFLGVLDGIDICTILKRNLTEGDFNVELKIAGIKEEAEKLSQGKKYEKYEYEFHCINIAKKIGLYDITEHVKYQDNFKYYFLSRGQIKKYMEDAIVNIKKEDPSLCAIVDASTDG
ncbi:hypothetical protein U1438_15460 [Aeromonas caviae]|uniref:hypothetical protein n=1 Tax=Aeromonas caviae TaxID=648 RepID=UPI00301495FA